MERNRPTRTQSGKIKFYSEEFGNLEKDDERNTKVTDWKLPHSGTSKSSSKSLSGKISRVTSTTSSSLGHTNQIKDWINQKSLQRIRDRHSVETHHTRQLYNRVLSNEENFVKGLEEYLKEQDLLNLRRKELLYKKWHQRVYVPLRKEVERSIESGFDKIDTQRRKEYDQYLDYSNKKGVVFLDVITEKEYNPLTLHSASSPFGLKARTCRLHDPLLVSERRRIAEDKVIIRCETGEVEPDSVVLARRLPPSPLVPLGRHETNCSTWLAMSLIDMESPERNRSRLRITRTSNLANIDFSTWNKTTAPEVADRELRIQKRRRFNIPTTKPSASVLDNAGKTARVRFANPPVTTTA
ncbi:protein FAM228B-like [Clavelina lepadiformis]|uniref:protein FAM228B-like n=1 Tax=Clavelina lepadiformis TaxID=159417 RepID=UPI00404363A6